MQRQISTLQEQPNLERYLKDISRFKPLPAQEEYRLARQIKQGSRAALEKLVKANLRFVVSVARTYEGQGVDVDDLINEGNAGLIKAAQRFDETKNFKFISYAVWYIRQAILQTLARQSRMFRLPPNQVGLIYRISKAQERLEQVLGRRPTEEEVAVKAGMPPAVVRTALRAAQPQVSLNKPLVDDDDVLVGDMVRDNDDEAPDQIVTNELTRAAVKEMLDSLDSREREVVGLYFGFGDHEPFTLDEIGEVVGLTRERVRQLKERALEKLRTESAELMLRESMN